MEKVVYVKAFFRAVGKNVTVKVPTGEKKKGIFGGEKDLTKKVTEWEQTGWSDTKIDGERLASDLERAINELNSEGYLVKAISPVTSGAYNYKYSSQGVTSSPRIIGDGEAVSGGGSFGFGYGYSYTESLIVVATKNA